MIQGFHSQVVIPNSNENTCPCKGSSTHVHSGIIHNCQKSGKQPKCPSTNGWMECVISKHWDNIIWP